MNFCGPMRAKCYLLWHINAIAVLNCHVCLEWPHLIYDLVVAFYGHRHAWSCMASLWPYMVFCGRISSFLAVIVPNSFGIVNRKLRFIWKTTISIRPVHTYEVFWIHWCVLNCITVMQACYKRNIYYWHSLFHPSVFYCFYHIIRMRKEDMQSLYFWGCFSREKRAKCHSGLR